MHGTKTDFGYGYGFSTDSGLIDFDVEKGSGFVYTYK